MAVSGGQAYYKRFLNDWRQSIQRYKQSRQENRRLSVTSITGRSDMASRGGHVREIEGFDSSRVRNFPFSSFKLLGALQIGIGAICVVLGVIDLFLFLYVNDQHDDETLSSLTIASVPIWCGLWFIVTGFMGSCMSLNQKTTLSYFKLTFMVLSVVCALLFAPLLCAVEIFICAKRTEGSSDASQWLFPLLIAFFGFNEIICAVITAAICCCCSPLNQAKVRVLYTRNVDDNREPSEKRRLSSPEIFYTDYHHSRRNTEKSIVPYNPHKNPQRNVMAIEEDQPEYLEPANQHASRPRAVMTAESPTPTYSRPPTMDGHNNYRRMKQMMDPNHAEAW